MAVKGRNTAAFERTLVALRNCGRLEQIDAAWVALGRTMAALMDDPAEPKVQCSYAYVRALDRLLGVKTDASEDDTFGTLLAAMRATVGDAPES